MKKLLPILLLSLSCTQTQNSFSSEKKLRVMIIDTGVDIDNIIIKPYLRDFKNLEVIDRNGHGTHIAGIIVAKACPGVEIIPCRGLGPVKDDYSQDWTQLSIDCYVKALFSDIDIINYSGGSSGPEYQETLAISLLTYKGVKIVAAAGNEDNSIDEVPYYPAALPGVIKVGSLNRDGRRAKKSNWGKDLVWEVGVNIVSEGLDNTKLKLTGTSQATAIHTSKMVEQFCQSK